MTNQKVSIAYLPHAIAYLPHAIAYLPHAIASSYSTVLKRKCSQAGPEHLSGEVEIAV